MQNLTTDRVRAVPTRVRGFADTVAARMPDLHDETGAQAAEYAMLGGVSAAACGGIVIVFNTSDLLPGFVGTILDTVSSFVSSWF